MIARQSTVLITMGPQFEHASESDKQKVREAQNLFQQAFNSQEFCDWMCNYSYQNPIVTGRWPFRKTTYQTVNGFHMNICKQIPGALLTGEQIYNQLKDGHEVLQKQAGADNEADITLDIDLRSTWGVIGYTYPTTATQWIYSKFFNKFQAWNVSGNIAHEWCHKMGYDHEYNSTPARPFSVPYAVGYKIEEIAKFYATGNR